MERARQACKAKRDSGKKSVINEQETVGRMVEVEMDCFWSNRASLLCITVLTQQKCSAVCSWFYLTRIQLCSQVVSSFLEEQGKLFGHLLTGFRNTYEMQISSQQTADFSFRNSLRLIHVVEFYFLTFFVFRRLMGINNRRGSRVRFVSFYCTGTTILSSSRDLNESGTKCAANVLPNCRSLQLAPFSSAVKKI